MTTQLQTLRRLAWEYHEVCRMDRYRGNVELHRAINDLRMVRPVVLLDEIPWHEMDYDGSLTCVCEDSALRDIETWLRRMLYRHRHFPADMLAPAYLPVNKIIHRSGIGLEVAEEVRVTDALNHIISHEYHDQLEDESAVDALRLPTVTYDEAETMRVFERVGNALGDILPVRLRGIDCFYTAPCDRIARYRGVQNLLIDLAERPEHTHRIVSFFSQEDQTLLSRYEELGLLDPDPLNLHCTAAVVSDLPGEGFDGTVATRKNIWGRGMAQIFASVSSAMHKEFDIDYQMQTIATCGLSYYGCCEPLDNKLDVVTKIPNLRKISITPWANTRSACEQIGGRYVVAAKPNPAAVAVDALDPAGIRKEIGDIVSACRDNGCSCDIVLKDISTCNRRPENIFAWEKAAMEVAQSFG